MLMRLLTEIHEASWCPRIGMWTEISMVIHRPSCKHHRPFPLSWRRAFLAHLLSNSVNESKQQMSCRQSAEHHPGKWRKLKGPLGEVSGETLNRTFRHPKFTTSKTFAGRNPSRKIQFQMPPQTNQGNATNKQKHGLPKRGRRVKPRVAPEQPSAIQ